LSNDVGASLFFVGTKHFGFNHNWIARTEPDERTLLRNPVLQETIDSDIEASKAIPEINYISLMQSLTNSEGVVVTDESGRLISPDRTHLTKYGAIFVGREIILESRLGRILSPLALNE
jgi:hypothetical protein